jgi:nucleoside-diphosphate-sugar epimerase
MKDRILIVGANGQIGSELVEAIMAAYGDDAVVATDISRPAVPGPAPFELLDVLDARRLAELVGRCAITQIWHLAASLSAKAETQPLKAWKLNMEGLLNVLDLAREKKLDRVFWPSSIAAFGPNSPKIDAPQHGIMEPTTIYGISKLAGERFCAYYHAKYGLDVRSLRYPGVISYKTPPGGGTTDYAIEALHAAKGGETYDCFLRADTRLPMIYMPDASRATLELMQADAARIRVRSSYNLAGVSFSAQELERAIRDRVPAFRMRYRPDARQVIADSWPQSIDDGEARRDWGWAPRFDLAQMVDDMLANIPREDGSAPIRATGD